MTKTIEITPEVVEKFLKEQMASHRRDIVVYRDMGIDSFLLGRLEECKFICERFGVDHSEPGVTIHL